MTCNIFKVRVVLMFKYNPLTQQFDMKYEQRYIYLCMHWSIRLFVSEFLAEKVYIGSMYVSGKLPTYPSPNLTLTLLASNKMLGLGRGRWAVSQKKYIFPFVFTRQATSFCKFIACMVSGLFRLENAFMSTLIPTPSKPIPCSFS